MEEKKFFTCRECGGNQLLVKEYYRVANLVTEVQRCDCGESGNGISYQKEYVVFEPGVDYYYLGNNHRFDEEANELNEEYLEVDGHEVDNMDVRIYCKSCYYRGGKKEIQYDPLDIEVGDVEFFVVCAGCGREIEFGWTYSGRDALIWPVECTDFDPRKCSPEPRYRPKWIERGWIKPDRPAVDMKA